MCIFQYSLRMFVFQVVVNLVFSGSCLFHYCSSSSVFFPLWLEGSFEEVKDNSSAQPIVFNWNIYNMLTVCSELAENDLCFITLTHQNLLYGALLHISGLLNFSGQLKSFTDIKRRINRIEINQ